MIDNWERGNTSSKKVPIIIASLLAAVTLTVLIVVNQFSQLTLYPTQNRTKSDLGTLRSALAIYYEDNEKHYPTSLDVLTGPYTVGGKTYSGRYLREIPKVNLGKSQRILIWCMEPHPTSTEVHYLASAEATDTGGWAYVNDPNSRDFGKIFINCTHVDLRGNPWSSY
jgi:hypothetical protein